jgi:NFU1 iron-sulfur cluster scaffold homolog, mitochondrial
MSFVKQSAQSMRTAQSSSKVLHQFCSARPSRYAIATQCSNSSRTFTTSASRRDLRSNARAVNSRINWMQNSSPLTFSQQKRSIFIQTESTPNEDSLKFLPGQSVMSNGTAEFLDTRSSMASPLAKTLFGIKGVKGVFYGPDFVTVSKDSDSHWNLLKPEIYASIMEFFSSGQELFPDPNSQQGASDTVILDTDSETVAMIKELLETRVRPAIQEDGGDIEYRGFGEDTDGIVRLKLKGSCRGCDSSTVTLKSGIERMLMHYIPEVKSVEQVLDPEEEVQLAEFAKLEARLEKERKQRDAERDLGFSP